MFHLRGGLGIWLFKRKWSIGTHLLDFMSDVDISADTQQNRTLKASQSFAEAGLNQLPRQEWA